MPSKRDRFAIMPEAENDDGSPTGRYFLVPQIFSGICPLTGEPEYEPDDTGDMLGPWSLEEARRVVEQVHSS